MTRNITFEERDVQSTNKVAAIAAYQQPNHVPLGILRVNRETGKIAEDCTEIPQRILQILYPEVLRAVKVL